MSRSKDIRSVLLYATGPLGDRVAGPEIRMLEFAKALSSHYEVTLMAEHPTTSQRDGIRVIPHSFVRLLLEAMRHDMVISPCLPPYLVAAHKLLRFKAVADKYDPHEVELVALQGEQHGRELRLMSLSLATQLRCADVVLCAGEQQRKQLQAVAHALDPHEKALRVDPLVVPFGIHPAPPPSARPLRAHFPQIAEDDKIVLWWGAVWRWLDAETPIRAFARLAATRPDIKLVITAGRAPNRNNERFAAAADARALAAELGVLGHTVLFLDEWVPYEERHDYLAEADLGLTLHRFSEEAQLAARARYMDYLAAALPCVLGRGDETAGDFERAGFATLIDDRDPDQLAATIVRLLDDPVRLDQARSAGRRLAEERSWQSVAERLHSAITTRPAEPPNSARGLAGLLGGTSSYYALKIAHRVLAAIG